MTKYLDKNGLITYEASIKERLEDKQDTLVSGTNIKTINNESLLGSGNITIGGGGTATDVKINGTSITSNNEADIQTEGTYNSSTNKIATMADVPADYVTIGTTQDITGAKTFKNVLNIQNGQGTGSMWIGGDVNASTLTNNSRHLARISVPSYSDVTLATTLLGFDSSGDTNLNVTNKDSDVVTFGGSKKITNATSPMAIGFCVANTRGLTAANRKVYPLEMDATQVRFNVQPNYNGNNLVTVNNLPTKTSDLTNDSGFITGYTETDPIFSASAASGITSSDITSWNNKSTFSGDYDDLTNKPSLATVATSGSYNDLSDKPTIPTVGNEPTYYGTCSTSASTQAKVVDCTGFVLETGATIDIKFTNKQSYNGAPTLNINSTGAISITGGLKGMWNNGDVMRFVYDGTTYRVVSNPYGTTTTYGAVMLSTAIDSSATNLAATSSAVRQAYNLADSKQDAITSTNKLDYSLLDNTPTIPTVPTTVSSFTNDAGYITSSALSGYATTSDLDDVQDQVDANSASIISNSNKIGTLTNLDTTTKADLVSAVNEVNTKVDDTGWQNLTTTSGTWDYFRYRKIGKLVMVEGYASSFTYSGSATAVTTIPAGYRPSQQQYGWGHSNGRRISRWWIETTGRLGIDLACVIDNGGTDTGTRWYYVKFEYYID